MLTEMQEAEDLLKIEATLLYIVKKFSAGVDYIKLFKLLYLAQKEHLIRYGRPIVNDTFVALKAGPAPSIMYNLCQIAEKVKTDRNLEPYTTGIKIYNCKSEKGTPLKHVKVSKSPDMDELSTSDIECIDLICKKYKYYKSAYLSSITHDKAWSNSRKIQGHKMNLLDIIKSDISPERLEGIRGTLMLMGIKD